MVRNCFHYRSYIFNSSAHPIVKIGILRSSTTYEQVPLKTAGKFKLENQERKFQLFIRQSCHCYTKTVRIVHILSATDFGTTRITNATIELVTTEDAPRIETKIYIPIDTHPEQSAQYNYSPTALICDCQQTLIQYLLSIRRDRHEDICHDIESLQNLTIEPGLPTTFDPFIHRVLERYQRNGAIQKDFTLERDQLQHDWTDGFNESETVWPDANDTRAEEEEDPWDDRGFPPGYTENDPNSTVAITNTDDTTVTLEPQGEVIIEGPLTNVVSADEYTNNETTETLGDEYLDQTSITAVESTVESESLTPILTYGPLTEHEADNYNFWYPGTYRTRNWILAESAWDPANVITHTDDWDTSNDYFQSKTVQTDFTPEKEPSTVDNEDSGNKFLNDTIAVQFLILLFLLIAVCNNVCARGKFRYFVTLHVFGSVKTFPSDRKSVV